MPKNNEKIMKIKRTLILPLLLIVSLAGFWFPLTAPSAMAGSGIPACSGAGSNSAVCKTDENLIGGILKNVINFMLYLAGTIAVIMMVIGGIRYITSDGDPQKATQAKNTILYALIGIVVAVLSFSIVNFVLGRL